jgi:hypothetical protein
MCSALSEIKESHWVEWVTKSKVDSQLTALSVKSLEGLAVYDYLFISDALPRLNSGRVSNTEYLKYQPLESGGWWVSGVDVLSPSLDEPDLWGQLKPNSPRRWLEFKGFGEPPKEKILKYEAPPKYPTGIFALPVPRHLWEAIAKRFNVPLPEDETTSFWKWVKDNPQIPLIITEGAKKAGCLITAEYVAIAQPGIWNGVRKLLVGGHQLIPQLAVFACKDREITFCFDNDPKLKTLKNVSKAIAITGKLFEKQGCKVSVVTWDFPDKGVDDLIVNRGVEAFHAAYNARISLSSFRLKSELSLQRYSPLKVKCRYLDSNLVVPKNAKLICLRSAKGTGKTEWLVKRVEAALREGERVIVIVHREQLARSLAERFGIDYRTEINESATRGALGYTLCIDSLHPKANPPFNPNEWQGATVIIDEAEQVIWHLLNSPTCQFNRIAIIQTFGELLLTAVATGGKIYLADADLAPISIEYVRSLVGLPLEPEAIWVVENQYQLFNNRKLVTYSGKDPRELFAALCKAIERGEKPLIHTSGQKCGSKWGTINLERKLSQKFPSLNILRIDRESVAEPGHPAYGCMSDLNNILTDYDAVICSPVVETGVSIDIKGHFNSVWCIAWGKQSVDAVAQAIERLREGVPRHIWAKKSAKNERIGSGTTNVRTMLCMQHKLTAANVSLLKQADIDEFDDIDTDCSASHLAWAKRACIDNAGKNDYRAGIYAKLREQGYEIVEYQSTDEQLLEAHQVAAELNETREASLSEYCEEVATTEALTDNELEHLKKKRAKTKIERLKERKGSLARRYEIEVTPSLVRKDESGWYSPLRLDYFFTVGREYLVNRDRLAYRNLISESGKAFKPDINNRMLSVQIRAMEILGIRQFLDPDGEFTSLDLEEFEYRCKAMRWEIKELLGVGINDRDKAIAIAQRILKKLDRRLVKVHWTGTGNERRRVYKLAPLAEDDNREEIFFKWLERDCAIAERENLVTA